MSFIEFTMQNHIKSFFFLIINFNISKYRHFQWILYNENQTFFKQHHSSFIGNRVSSINFFFLFLEKLALIKEIVVTICHFYSYSERTMHGICLSLCLGAIHKLRYQALFQGKEGQCYISILCSIFVYEEMGGGGPINIPQKSCQRSLCMTLPKIKVVLVPGTIHKKSHQILSPPFLQSHFKRLHFY